MGFLDYLILGNTGSIFVITSLLLLISLKSTDDPVKQNSYKRTYLPMITLCIMVFGVYIAILNIGKLII